MANTEGLLKPGSICRATSCIFEKLRDLPDYSNSKIALISGFTIDCYPHSERAEKIELMIQIEDTAQAVKSKLLALYPHAFTQVAEIFSYREAGKPRVQIDLIPARFCPFMPQGAKAIRDIEDDKWPCLSVTDLIVFNVWTCSLRPTRAERNVQRLSANELLRKLENPLNLLPQQEAALEEGLPYLLHTAKKQNEDWWRKSLGLAPRPRS